MGCACGSKNRAVTAASAVSGTYRVMVKGRQVYESSNEKAAESVAANFTDAVVLAPGKTL